MTDAELASARARLAPYVERAKSFTGWSFSGVREVRLPQDLPWSYGRRARRLMVGAKTVLDLDTGGGELFAQLCAGFHGRAVATEEWTPNVRVAASRLRPLGIEVTYCRSKVLPMRDGSIELILNRHGGFEPEEVARVLALGGTFLTQQVDAENWAELRRFFPRIPEAQPQFERYRAALTVQGLQLGNSRKHQPRVAYGTLGDLVYMLCVISSAVPDIDPLGHDLEALLDLERELSTPDGIVLTESRYIIEARKPA